jgi:hypothetical protein
MRSIKNSKKNDANNLLPQRGPRLAKYIALAVMLHVFFVIVYIYFTQPKSEDHAEVKERPVKVAPIRPPQKMLHHQVESESTPSSRIEKSLMTPPLLAAFSEKTPQLSPARRFVKPSILRSIHLDHQNLKISPARKEGFSSKEAISEEIRLEKQMAREDMHLVPLPQIEPAPRFMRRQKRHTDYRALSDWKKTIDLAEQLQFSVTSKRDTAVMVPNRSPAMHAALYLPEENILLPQLLNLARRHPTFPKRIEDYLTDLVRQLIQPALKKYKEPNVRILTKNLTYRDLGLESEGTKYLSSLIKNEIENLEGTELLSPSDVFRNPQIVVEGEMWDHSEQIKVHLRLLDRETGGDINTVEAMVSAKMIPGGIKLQPPSGENLPIIQKIVQLMQQYFPQGGDFQLGVWPDKGLDAVYIEDEKLMVYILPEKNAYLRVDYYQIDGKVVHLLPNKQEDNFVEGGNPYIIGDPSSGRYQFIISAPFGEELLVVVASQNPFRVVAHDLIEPAEPYIKRLASSLGKQRKKDLMAGSHYIILTKKRDSQNSSNESVTISK